MSHLIPGSYLLVDGPPVPYGRPWISNMSCSPRETVRVKPIEAPRPIPAAGVSTVAFHLETCWSLAGGGSGDGLRDVLGACETEEDVAAVLLALKPCHNNFAAMMTALLHNIPDLYAVAQSEREAGRCLDRWLETQAEPARKLAGQACYLVRPGRVEQRIDTLPSRNVDPRQPLLAIALEEPADAAVARPGSGSGFIHGLVCLDLALTVYVLTRRSGYLVLASKTPVLSARALTTALVSTDPALARVALGASS